MKILKMPQKSPDWWLARRGLPCSSSMDKIITPVKGELSKSMDKYVYQLIAERMSNRAPGPADEYISEAMREGIRNEPHARRWYESFTEFDVEQIGLAVSDCGRFCSSTDGLLVTDSGNYAGALELKCPQAAAQAEYLIEGRLPESYKVQVHGELLVTGLPFVDFVSYCPGLETFHLRIERDAFTEKLGAALEAFWERYVAALAKVGYKGELP
jgi:hypothetical protein